MTDKVYNLNINEDEQCPSCGKGGSVNHGLCLSCANKKAKLLANGLIDETTIKTILNTIEEQLREKAELANATWRTNRADKIKVLSLAITIGKDRDGLPECKLDFGYAEKIGADFSIQQRALPGMK